VTANKLGRATLAGLVATVTIVAVTGLGAPAGAGTVATSGGTWGNAQELPGIAALNADGTAYLETVSCASAGNCSAGGSYLDGSGATQAFVANQAGGTWGTAQEVPGTAALNIGRFASVRSVLCVSPGNCTAGGYYQAANGEQAFTVTETAGTWGKAKEVPGSGALNTRGNGTTGTVSCASPGNCAATGSYAGNFGLQVYVATQSNGIWGKAKELPGIAALNTGGNSDGSLSCSTAGNCGIAGMYEVFQGGSYHNEAYAGTETNGVWGKAKEVPGTATLNIGGNAAIDSLSCALPGACSAGGYYTDNSGNEQSFVVTESNGLWGKAKEAPGSGALNAGRDAGIASVSCASVGNCSAGGDYTDSSGNRQALVVTESKAVWGKAQEMPGIQALDTGGGASVSALSCASAGNCTAGGSYQDSSGHTQVFVVNETNP
jgi:hypothetical protein